MFKKEPKPVPQLESSEQKAEQGDNGSLQPGDTAMEDADTV